MPRLTLLLPLLAVLSSPSLLAQDLHIYYDAYADSVAYVQNGKRIYKPAVRKGDNVVLHVNNYNNYLYHVALKTSNAGLSTARAFPLDGSSLGGGGGSPLDLLFGSGSSLGFGMPQLGGLSRGDGAGMTAAEQARQARMAEIQKQAKSFSNALTRVQNSMLEIADIQSKVQMAIEAQQIQSFAAEELQRLRLNPQLSPDQLKALSQEYIARIFGETDPKKIDLGAVLKKTDAKGEFAALKQGYEKEVSNYAQDVALMKNLSAFLSEAVEEVPESSLGSFVRDAEKVVATAEGNLETYEENLHELDEKTAAIQGLDAKTLADLRIAYLVTMENDFTKTFRQSAASGDDLALELVFTPVDSISIPGLATRAVSPIEVKVYGGLQVNASVGLSFGQFFNRPQSYFVRDSVIRSSDQDAFTPFLTSFVHFYPQSRRETSLGGSFGVGIPLGGSGATLESITFFLGPSLVFGRNQRIVLSGGLIGGRVSQLANGYAVGDRFELQPDFLQTELVYRLGYAVGLSFNLIRGN
jgi:hypothetical protein